MASRRSPRWWMATLGRSSGVAARDRSRRTTGAGGPACGPRRATAAGGVSTVMVVPLTSSATDWTTSVWPPAVAVCTPSPEVSASMPPLDQRHTRAPVASSTGLAVNSTSSGPDVHDGADVHVVGRDRLAVDEQLARPAAVGAHDEAPVTEARRRPGRPLHPGVVLVREEDAGAAGRRIHGVDVDGPLVAGLDGDERPVVVPGPGGEVRPGLAVPADPAPGAVEPEDPRAHVGVVRARGGVGHLRRCLRGSGGVGDPPAVDRRVVHRAPRAARHRRAPTRSRDGGPSPRRR